VAVHEVEEGGIVFGCVGMTAFAVGPTDGAWAVEEVINFVGRLGGSVGACGVCGVVFVGFGEQEAAWGDEGVEEVVVVGESGVLVAAGGE